MKTAILIISFLSGLLLFSTAVCGLWLYYGGDKITDYTGSVNFHMGIAFMTGIFTFLALGLSIISAYKLNS